MRQSNHHLPIENDRLTLKLDLVLNNEGVVLVVNGLGELGGDGVVSSLILDDKTLVTLHTLQNSRLLDGPVADVCPLLVISLDVLLCVRSLPSSLPVVCELLEERSLDCGGLCAWLGQELPVSTGEPLTVKVGFATEVEEEASAAGSSARTTAAASAAVAPIEKRIVIACCRKRAEVLVEGFRG